jgi:carbon-monoxide dehydrogenase large subunit
LTGGSCFADDLNPPGALHAAILRSPHAHATLVSLDVARARCHPGVVAVFTREELPADARIPMRMYPRPGMEQMLQPPLARDAVRYSGEPVAVVVAQSRYVAEDALEQIDVAYEPLEVLLDCERALAAGAPLLHPHVASNVASEIVNELGDVDAVFAQADHVFRERLYCGRHAAVPLEPRGLVAAVDKATGRLTMWGAAKVVHTNRRLLSTMLGWPQERIRLVELDVGGGFGARGEFYPEDFLIPFCAIAVERTVAWTEDREENLRALNHSREQLHDLAIAVDDDGTLLAFRDEFVLNTGAYVRTHGSVVPGLTGALLPGPYAWQAHRSVARQVVTNKTPAGTYRSPGRYEANFARERMIDIVAHRLGRDPADLRRQNLIPVERMPYLTGTAADDHPVEYDSGDYRLLLDKTTDLFEVEEMRRWREQAPPGRARGIGVGLFVEKAGIARWEYARVGVDAEGAVRAYVGAASVGQGVRTVLAQVCAEAMGVAYEAVTVIHGDTDVVPEGMGAFGSRASMLAGSAVAEATEALRGRLVELAAQRLEADPGDLEIVGERVVARGSRTVGVDLGELVRDAGGDELCEEARFDCPDMGFPYGVHYAAVEVDLETGAVAIERYAIGYDVGRAINPLLVEGQIVGGLAQGLGGALLEELAYDAGGQLVAGSLMDYLMPTAVEMPHARVLVTEDAPSPLNPLGVKGAGEGGTAAAGAAIANAVSDAIGAEALALPLHPERVLALAAQCDGASPDPSRPQRVPQGRER